MLTEKKQSLMLVINPTAGKNQARDKSVSAHQLLFYAQLPRNEPDTGQRRRLQLRRGVCDAIRCPRLRRRRRHIKRSCHRTDDVSGGQTAASRIHPAPTNDFANTLGISSVMEEAAEQFCPANRFAVTSASLTADISRMSPPSACLPRSPGETPQPLKNALGHAAYLLEGAKSLTSIKSYALKVRCDEEEINGKFIYGQLSNLTSIGGILNITVPAFSWTMVCSRSFSFTCQKIYC